MESVGEGSVSLRAKALDALRDIHAGSNQSWIRAQSREALAAVQATSSEDDGVRLAVKALEGLSNAAGDRWVKRLAAQFVATAAARRGLDSA